MRSSDVSTLYDLYLEHSVAATAVFVHVSACCLPVLLALVDERHDLLGTGRVLFCQTLNPTIN